MKKSKTTKTTAPRPTYAFTVTISAVDENYKPSKFNDLPVVEARGILGHDTLAVEFKQGGGIIKITKAAVAAFDKMEQVIADSIGQITSNIERENAEIEAAYERIKREEKQHEATLAKAMAKAKKSAKKQKPALAKPEATAQE